LSAYSDGSDGKFRQILNYVKYSQNGYSKSPINFAEVKEKSLPVPAVTIRISLHAAKPQKVCDI
jgi:hypothetical protein